MDDVARLSHALESALLADAKRAPRGAPKCPECGMPVEPTKNGRIRVHDSNPLRQERCPASGKSWKSFGKRPGKRS